MRKVMMVMAALAMVTPMAARAQQQQEDKQAATRRELQQKMQQLQQQMRDLQREMNQLEPATPRARVYSTGPMVQVFGNRAYLGVNVAWDRNPATDSIGAVLTSVTPGGAAEKAGLQAGDIITTFNGDKLTGRYPAAGEGESQPGRKLVDFAQDLENGDTVVVDYRRGKETHRATIVARQLGAGNWGFSLTTPSADFELHPEAMAQSIREAMPLLAGVGIYGRWLDLELVKLNPELGDYFGTTDGLLVIRAPDDSVLPLKGGDVILSIDGRPVTSQAQLMRVLRSYEPSEDVKLDIMRQKRRTTLSVKIPQRRERRDGFDFRYDQDWER
jgi:S1-C subfamily serine protease